MKGRKLTHSAVAKTTAFFLVVVLALLAAACAVGGAFVIDQGILTTGSEVYKRELFYNEMRNDSWNIVHAYLQPPERGIQEIAEGYQETNFHFELRELDGENVRILGPTGTIDSSGLFFEFEFDSHDLIGYEGEANSITYLVRAGLDLTFPFEDGYKTINSFVNLLYSMRYAFFIIGILAALLAAACFVFLMFSAGHRAGEEELHAGGLVKAPLELLLFIAGFGIFSVLFFAFDNGYYMGGFFSVALMVLGAVLALIIGTGLCMNLAVRAKLGRWWENTLIYRLLMLCRRLLKAIWQGLVALFLNLPMIWKTALLLTAITGLELLTFAAFFYDTSWIFMAWLLTRPVVFAAVLYLALVLRRLQRGGEALADGDLSYQVNTKYMVWDFKKHGQKLNRIAEGMALAVEERLKSERFKTELITNVSHDLKTPLTSIVNYAELIGREETENPHITEYAQVLLRQSERLKSLIENLVEASKASTGNVEALLAPCEVGVLLTQTVGEYEQRLEDRSLALIVKQPETPVKIMADGRLLWRVFDNLMNNICKYAQSGTRVYLCVETKGNEAIISFKNTSSYALDIPADELFERFVRNDAARSSEGNGLGLSIAQSLTELQNGKLALTVDGDLFKATLHFPVLS